MNGTILLKKGRYVETILGSKSVSDISFKNDGLPFKGFSIVGDQREIVSTTYLQAGFTLNPAEQTGMGNNGASLTLSNVGNIITVATTEDALDFSSAQVVVGDIIKIRSDSGDWTEANVTAVFGNTITHDGGDISVNGKMSAFVIAPCVEILPSVAGQPAMAFYGMSVNLTGLWLNSDVAHGATSGALRLLAGEKNSMTMVNCLIDNIADSIARVFGIALLVEIKFNASLLCTRYKNFNDDSSANNTVLKGVIRGINNSTLNLGNLSVFDETGGFECVVIENSSTASISRFQAVNSSAGGANASNNSSLTVGSFNIFKGNLGFIANFGSIIRLSSGGTMDFDPVDGSLAMFANRNSHFRLRRTFNVNNASTGIDLQAVSSANVDGGPPTRFNFIGTTGVNIKTEYLCIFGGVRYTAGSATVPATPGNLFTYTGTPEHLATLTVEGLQNAFSTQLIDTDTAINLPLNPSVDRRYIGKTFTISADQAAAVGNHTLTLVGGAVFKGPGASGFTTAEFTSVDASITFIIESTSTVRVVASNFISFV